MTEALVTAVIILSVCLAAALATLAWLWRSQRRLRQSLQENQHQQRHLEHYLTLMQGEAQHLAEHRIPALVSSLWNGEAGEQPRMLHRELEGTACDAVMTAILGAFDSVAHQAVERAEEAARAAVKTVTRSMQALLNEQQGAILEMLQRHDDERVLADANAIDHASSQLARRAQVIGVLTGSWPGRQRDASPLVQVVRGGVSRIRDYQRVRISGEPPFAVVSRAVEPVVLAVAELLDNAARHSQPGADVHVWFVQGHNGVAIMIDDAGVGLRPEDRQTAARLLTGERPVHLTQLGNPPQFGWAVVGVLAHRYGFRASVEKESDFGGVRASVYLPNELLEPVAEDVGHPQDVEPAVPDVAGGIPDPVGEGADLPRRRRRAASPALTTHAVNGSADRPAPQPADASESTVASPAAEAPDVATDLGGLPQRRRRTGPSTRATAPRMRVPQDASQVMGAFLRGRGAAHSTRDDERNSDQ